LNNKDQSKVKDQRGKQDNPRQEKENNRTEEYRSTDLHDSPMMARLISAMEQGQDVGEYGRLTFVMVARHFIEEDEMQALLVKQPGMEEKDARALILQVKNRGYNPPKRERILQWQERQEFQICPDTDDPNGCNVYRELKFPDEIYDQINDFWEEKAEAEDQ
jgi:hypothetical protein